MICVESVVFRNEKFVVLQGYHYNPKF